MDKIVLVPLRSEHYSLDFKLADAFDVANRHEALITLSFIAQSLIQITILDCYKRSDIERERYQMSNGKGGLNQPLTPKDLIYITHSLSNQPHSLFPSSSSLASLRAGTDTLAHGTRYAPLSWSASGDVPAYSSAESRFSQ